MSLRQKDFTESRSALDSGAFYHPDWFYGVSLSFPGEKVNDDRRLASLPTTEDIDFWINLQLGRYSRSHVTVWPTPVYGTFITIFVLSHAPTPAVTEICAIPELRATWAFTLLSSSSL